MIYACLIRWLTGGDLALLHRPRLYFVKVDVRSCFDTIEQSTLMDVLADLLQDVRVFATFHPSNSID